MFVDKLTNHLAANFIPFWRDTSQLSIGDSIISSVEDALNNAKYMCIVLSKNSISSPWVKRELKAALVREFDENNIKILPIIIDDCEIPLFLRDINYADFRKNFETGLRQIIHAVSDNYNLHYGQFTNKNITTSFGTDVVIYENGLEIYFDAISCDEGKEYFILTKTKISCNDGILTQYNCLTDKKDQKDLIVQLIKICGDECGKQQKAIVISGAKMGNFNLNIENSANNLSIGISIQCKKVGNDDGKYVMFPVAS
ncbi:MAG: toll/interleukin-1 receptor domain-containing protein [Saprospiraceae bacterium]|nr:toll/interleukin-1 receptor domain-containing protein [Saprospiraceae bacterium]